MDLDENIIEDIEEKDEGYVSQDDPNFQYKLYKKREFFIHKTKERPDIKSYEELKDYRKKICAPSEFTLTAYQNLLPSFLNPDTPYTGLLMYCGLGSGKTISSVSIAQSFIPQIQRYGTKIYIIVPGPLLRRAWQEEILKCTGNFFYKENKNMSYYTDEEKEQLDIKAKNEIKQYYKIMSYKSLHRKVMGNKILEKEIVENSKVKKIYKTSKDGDYERDVISDQIISLDNTLIIYDEAHNLTGNEQGGETLRILREKSTNLKILLLTATPFKNLADDGIELLNFLRPLNSQINRDKIFSGVSNYKMTLKEGGLEYFKKMASGYVSHFRGADELTYATKLDMGVKPKGLLFTKVVRCYMNDFQQKLYDSNDFDTEEDALDRKSESIANFVIPVLDDEDKLIGSFGLNGLNDLKNKIKSNSKLLNKLVATEILKVKYDENIEYITYNQTRKTIDGDCLKKENLKHFSTKFYDALCNIEEDLFTKEPCTGFVYSNLVKIGIDIFESVLLKNGFLEYNENNQAYNIQDNTKCYHCGKCHLNHPNTTHSFSPATYIKVTGNNPDSEEEIMQEEKQKIIMHVFNDPKNKQGKLAKLVLGSKVMNEGISLKTIGAVYVLDTYYNFSRLEQVIGRAIRYCSHYLVMTKDNPYPKVKVYKYVVSLKSGELSSEELLYFKAEKKYLLVKKMERALKEVAIDCALNISGNQFKEEIEKYKKCEIPSDKNLESENIDSLCVDKCDFNKCDYKCDDKILNMKYYDPTRNVYKKIPVDKLDNSTITAKLMGSEINYAKQKIKNLFYINYIYNLDTITEFVKKCYENDEKELFDVFYIYKALDEFMPITENDFLNMEDALYDKYNRKGYIIYVNGYYLFQPLSEKENLMSYYRKKKNIQIHNNVSLCTFMKTFKNYDDDDNIEKYDFDMGRKYYDSREEWDYVGILDYDVSLKKDVFKLRDKIKDKQNEKKRGTGINSYNGSACFNSKPKKYLNELAKILKISNCEKLSRPSLCDKIYEILFKKEKYQTGENKKTYLIIPYNHPVFKFPLNLEDQVEHYKNLVDELYLMSQTFTVENDKNVKYILKFKNSKTSIEIQEKLKELGFINEDDEYMIELS